MTAVPALGDPLEVADAVGSGMDSITRIIAAYDGQGIHRTGTAVDDASARWLADEIKRIGVTPELVRFCLDRIDVVTARATVAGVTYEGLPRFDAPPTGPDGVAGRLGRPGSTAEIALVLTAARGDLNVEVRAPRPRPRRHAEYHPRRSAGPDPDQRR